MDTLLQENYVSLNLSDPVWDRVFTVAPLVIIGTKEESGFDLAPKHMATPLSFGNYFGFVCTPNHHTYHNVKNYGEFTVSFPRPAQIVATSLSATPRRKEISKSEGVLSVLDTIQAKTMDAPIIKNAYLYLECELFKIIDGFDENSLIAGKIKAAHVHKDYLRLSENDEQEQLKKHPLLGYIANGRFAEISETFNFPFPKDFKR